MFAWAGVDSVPARRKHFDDRSPLWVSCGYRRRFYDDSSPPQCGHSAHNYRLIGTIIVRGLLLGYSDPTAVQALPENRRSPTDGTCGLCVDRVRRSPFSVQGDFDRSGSLVDMLPRVIAARGYSFAMTTGHVFIASSLGGFIARLGGDIDWLEGLPTEGEDHGFQKFMSSVDGVITGGEPTKRLCRLGSGLIRSPPVMVLSNFTQMLRAQPLAQRIRNVAARAAHSTRSEGDAFWRGKASGRNNNTLRRDC
ncbi:hypothetical protein SAMN04488557_3787 [Hyphomicrobium facile]|uniref:Uncharacterized protein n=1 Tax=Hyphomicrobium facile TaxID=51670 RepID=A0A1I7NVJ7_9HYPH|nr:hypothetical protein SAMN04488557_3787 [Hyphomicrobium facile]